MVLKHLTLYIPLSPGSYDSALEQVDLRFGPSTSTSILYSHITRFTSRATGESVHVSSLVDLEKDLVPITNLVKSGSYYVSWQYDTSLTPSKALTPSKVLTSNKVLTPSTSPRSRHAIIASHTERKDTSKMATLDKFHSPPSPYIDLLFKNDSGKVPILLNFVVVVSVLIGVYSNFSQHLTLEKVSSLTPTWFKSLPVAYSLFGGSYEDFLSTIFDAILAGVSWGCTYLWVRRGLNKQTQQVRRKGEAKRAENPRKGQEKQRQEHEGETMTRGDGEFCD